MKSATSGLLLLTLLFVTLLAFLLFICSAKSEFHTLNKSNHANTDKMMSLFVFSFVVVLSAYLLGFNCVRMRNWCIFLLFQNVFVYCDVFCVSVKQFVQFLCVANLNEWA